MRVRVVSEAAPNVSQDVRADSPIVPPLENGDHLTRPEFERRYDAMPRLKRAELIEGVVYMPSPVTVDHGSSHFRLISWLGFYYLATPGTDGGDNGSLRLDMDNMPQPDAYLMILPEHGGQARIDADRFIAAAPELVAEVAVSSVSYDLHQKLEAYRRNGVLEYITWRVLDETIDWRVLRDGRYELMAPDEDGIYRSECFPGLWLDATALIRAERPALVRVLQAGLASAEHAEFVARLQQTAGQS